MLCSDLRQGRRRRSQACVRGPGARVAALLYTQETSPSAELTRSPGSTLLPALALSALQPGLRTLLCARSKPCSAGSVARQRSLICVLAYFAERGKLLVWNLCILHSVREADRGTAVKVVQGGWLAQDVLVIELTSSRPLVHC